MTTPPATITITRPATAPPARLPGSRGAGDMVAGDIGAPFSGSDRAGQGAPSPLPAALWLPVVIAGLATATLAWWAIGSPVWSAGFGAGLVALALLVWLWRRPSRDVAEPPLLAADFSITRQLADDAGRAVAVTDRAGRMVCASMAWLELFGPTAAPPGLGLSGPGNDWLKVAARAAWREGEGVAPDLARGGVRLSATVRRTGRAQDHLLWTFARIDRGDAAADYAAMLGGRHGLALARAGVMAALVGPEGRVRAANAAFTIRAAGRADASLLGRDVTALLRQDDRQGLAFVAEGAAATPLRLVSVPLPGAASGAGAGPDPGAGDAGETTLLCLIDEDGGGAERGIALSYVETLLSLLPAGLALVDRDGRFLFVNRAFTRASGTPSGRAPRYPGDIVVPEDKAPLADMIRRHGVGQQAAGDITVRLAAQPDQPVPVRVIGVRGLGDASVLLSLKDNQEATRLQGQVAQASKMQAIGQLAGGIAHDFNNILTAILGACDLMLMRHTPGDGDYDDIQQIRSNASRAASLTRQLLAFSRQQTLRPRTVQLPDIVSDISHLLKRLLGERITLDVRHGRGLQPVRADPGQLEQVIVNLAVNGRDAMLDGPSGLDAQGAGAGAGGTLTIETLAVTPADMRALGHAIMPPGHYSCIRVTDTGTGIAPDALAKIYEPFFTTKEAGKGTGLGLSTVYGIVKQSAGFVFADSVQGQGTSFSIYLPAHQPSPGDADPAPATPPPPAAAPEWGSGTVLLVEDEDMVRAVAERALTRAGYTVITAAHGEDGLAAIERACADAPGGDADAPSAPSGVGPGIDIVVTDVVMPTMDGPAMVRRIRATAPDLPVIFMSGYAEEQLRDDLSDLATGFLPKPFSVAELVAMVGRTLGAAQPKTDDTA